MAGLSQDEIANVDFDIGHFVNSYDSLMGQLSEFKNVLYATDSLRRWEVPSLTFLCCVFVVTLCIAFPEFLLAFCLAPIPLVLLVTYVKSVGKKSEKQVKHIVVMAVENEEQKLKRKKEMIDKATKDLGRFIRIMCELQHWMKEVRKKLDLLQSLFSWEDPQITLRFMGCVFAAMFSFCVVPVSLIILAGFLVIFLKNEDFNKVFLEYLTVFKFYDATCKSETVLDKQKEYSVEWFDASGTVETDNSSYEDESSESEEETFDKHVSPGKPSRSFVSHISEYRRRRQELNKGNCAACEVAFSSLLTRRRYCRRCGDKFCSKCCRHYVTKAALGATAPGSRDQRVLVCNDCYGKLRATTAPD